jgi:hypothetical protein
MPILGAGCPVRTWLKPRRHPSGPGNSRPFGLHQRGMPGVFQSLLGNSQFLHLSLRQLPLLDRQSSLLDPQTGLPGLGSKFTGENIEVGIL